MSTVTCGSSATESTPYLPFCVVKTESKGKGNKRLRIRVTDAPSVPRGRQSEHSVRVCERRRCRRSFGERRAA